MKRDVLLGLIQEKLTKKYTKDELAKIIDAFGKVGAESLAVQVDFPIPHLGHLRTKLRRERVRSNPRTKERMTLPADYIVKFSALTALKKEINDKLSFNLLP